MSSSALQKMQEGSRSKTTAEKYNYEYWDRHTISDGVQKVELFKVPKGQPNIYGVTKTLADTNIVVPGQVANGKKFVCLEMAFFYSSVNIKHTPEAVPALYKLIEDSTIVLEIDGKQDMGRWTLSECFGSAINFFTDYKVVFDDGSNVNPAIAYSQSPNVMSACRNRIKFTIPLVLASLQIFSFVLEHHSKPDILLNGDVFKMVLMGVQASLQ